MSHQDSYTNYGFTCDGCGAGAVVRAFPRPPGARVAPHRVVVEHRHDCPVRPGSDNWKRAVKVLRALTSGQAIR